MAVYFGGSRHLVAGSPAHFLLCHVVHAAILANQEIHTGCQRGADQQVIQYIGQAYSGSHLSSLVVFAVAPMSNIPAHIHIARSHGALCVPSAGGQSAPIPARYLLRSIAAFQGCNQAVFFSPGSGSLAVARECVRTGLPVFAFQSTMPAPVPLPVGVWVASSFLGFACWQWSAPTQPALF